jgi:hypothetical protein
MTEPIERDYKMYDAARARAASRYRDGTVAWFAELRDQCVAAIAEAREEGRREERERCAEIARAWIYGAPTTTTQRVAQEIVLAIRFGMSEKRSKK